MWEQRGRVLKPHGRSSWDEEIGGDERAPQVVDKSRQDQQPAKSYALCRRIVSWVLTAGYDGLGGQDKRLRCTSKAQRGDAVSCSCAMRLLKKVKVGCRSVQDWRRCVCRGAGRACVYIWADSERSWGCASVCKRRAAGGVAVLCSRRT